MTKIMQTGIAFCAAVIFSTCASAGPAEDNCLLAIGEHLPAATVMQRANTRAVSTQTVSAITQRQPGNLVKNWVQADVTISLAGRAIAKTYFCGDHINGSRVVWQIDSPGSHVNAWVVP